ncbi:hypothetical protein DRP04_02665 [Archaeoglobales archaeon]|nr:MAG: hypothetical protein DRP04_02665 [Archaeoglobales archaeon]HDN74288.1 hypothetical protein [Archaeoglobus sp.]
MFPVMIKQKLIEALEEWLNKNNKIGEKWENLIRRELRKFENEKATISIVAGFALWAFNLICNFGVTAVVGTEGYKVSESTWEKGFDRKTTENLLFWINEAVKLMQIPKEVAEVMGWV